MFASITDCYSFPLFTLFIFFVVLYDFDLRHTKQIKAEYENLQLKIEKLETAINDPD